MGLYMWDDIDWIAGPESVRCHEPDDDLVRPAPRTRIPLRLDDDDVVPPELGTAVDEAIGPSSFSAAIPRRPLPPRESGPATPFSDIRDAVLDEEGRLYVLDRGMHRIVVVDSTGAVERVFGSRGRGPGEMIRPADLSLVGDTILVTDNGLGRITYFAKSGKLYRSERMDRVVGGRFARGMPISGSVWVLEPVVLARPGTALTMQPIVATNGVRWDTIESCHTATIQIRLRDEPARPFGVPTFGAGGYWAVAPSSKVLTVVRTDGGIRSDYVRSADGKWTRLEQTHLNLPTYATSDADRDEAREHVATVVERLGYAERDITVYVPEFRSSLTGMFYDDLGCLWVRPRSDEVPGIEWLVYDQGVESPLRVEMPVGFDPIGVAHGRLYGVHTDSLDVQTPRIYRLSRSR